MPCREHTGKRSARAEENHKLYGRDWRRARLAYLADHPLCECDDCRKNGWLKPATVIDHIIPHKGDLELFWDSENNWMAMSARCHSIKTAREDGGFGNAPRSA
jgi:5-methylcytosine-specific restriction protein A